MDWFRWHNGTTTDPKWRAVARRVGARVADVVAVWAALCENANQADERGTLERFDCEDVAAALDLDTETVQKIHDAMQGKVLDGVRVARLRGRPTFVSPRPPAHEWEALRRHVFERDNYTCQYCGVRGERMECDHIHPVSLGGGSDPSNLATSCRRCNRAKRAKTVAEWTGRVS